MSVLRYVALALVAAAASQSATAACYLVYAPDHELVYRAPVPPVDLSREIHETLPLVAPGGSLVFSLDNEGCEITVNKLPLASVRQARQDSSRPARADRG